MVEYFACLPCSEFKKGREGGGLSKAKHRATSWERMTPVVPHLCQGKQTAEPVRSGSMSLPQASGV